MIRRAENAWRSPPSVSKDAAEPDTGTPPERMRPYAEGRPDLGPTGLMRRHLRGNEPDNASATREKAYADYKARLESAWRGRTGSRH
jgi:hypothetical protein